jgi:hypothetical protein
VEDYLKYKDKVLKDKENIKSEPSKSIKNSKPSKHYPKASNLKIKNQEHHSSTSEDPLNLIITPIPPSKKDMVEISDSSCSSKKRYNLRTNRKKPNFSNFA